MNTTIPSLFLLKLGEKKTNILSPFDDSKNSKNHITACFYSVRAFETATSFRVIVFRKDKLEIFSRNENYKKM